MSKKNILTNAESIQLPAKSKTDPSKLIWTLKKKPQPRSFRFDEESWAIINERLTTLQLVSSQKLNPTTLLKVFIRLGRDANEAKLVKYLQEVL